MTKINKKISFLKATQEMKANRFLKIGMIGVGLIFTACQGQLTDRAPLHPNLNMDQQLRLEAQEKNSFFADNRSMRQPVEGTVARGLLKSDVEYYEGVDESGEFISSNPVDLTKSFLYRGKERYEIFCTPCHGMSGAGDGMVIGYGFVPPPSFHNERILDMPDGEIYSAIHNGVRTMPSYRTQIPVEDRWAIVAYVRALQNSRNVDETEIQQYDTDVEALREEYQQALASQQEAEAEEETETSDAADAAADDAAEETSAPSVEEGRELFAELTCQVCHSVDGTPSIGPTMQGLYNSEGEVITDEGETITVVKDEEYITESILSPMVKKPVEYADGIMSQIPVETHEVEALIEYIKSLSEN